MTTKKLFSSASLAAFAMICFLPGELSAQVPADLPAEFSPDSNSKDPIELVISYGENNEARMLSHRGVVEPVSLLPNHLTPFSLQFPINKRGLPVAFGPIDGGGIIPMASVTDIAVSSNGTFTFNYEPAEELIVGEDGIVRFGFQSGYSPGLHRVMVHLPGEEHILQFYVISLASPAPTFWQP